MNQAWSETGDRYILKLFRDYVFHAVGFEGEPIVDVAHIIQCLNKVKRRSFHQFFTFLFLQRIVRRRFTR